MGNVTIEPGTDLDKLMSIHMQWVEMYGELMREHLALQEWKAAVLAIMQERESPAAVDAEYRRQSGV